jgi:hypothetical protein
MNPRASKVMSCPSCASDSITPLNIEETVFECVRCAHRFHIYGIAADDLVILPDPESGFPAMSSFYKWH